MKSILSLSFLFVCTLASAQLGVSVLTDSPQTALQRLQEQQQWISDTSKYVQMIQQSVQMVRDADQALQYQIQALQTLRGGSWDDFVEAYSYETAAISQLNQTFTDFSNIDAENIKNMMADPSYRSFAQRLQMLNHAMQSSNGIVQSSNMLVKNTVSNLKTSGQLVAKSSRESSPVAQLQLQAQQLGILAQQLSDVQTVLAATANHNLVLQQNEMITINQEKKVASEFLRSNGGAGIYDQSDPEKHWQAVTGGNWDLSSQ